MLRPNGNYDLYLRQTPSQTLGPFFHQGLVRTRRWFQGPALCPDEEAAIGNVLVDEHTRGQRIRLEGVVYDGLGEPVIDALLEIWQADASGSYDHPLDPRSQASGKPRRFGFGRAPTDERGVYFFETVKPGAVPTHNQDVLAPHVNLILGARGMARHAFTRAYFDSDQALAEDPILALVPRERRRTLIARALPGRTDVVTYRFDIHLQGEDETVFFEL
jgi:protocatechuate 3,4-dioxygenase alpha subunit